ncbi:hypothetical protein BC831DRAFT_443509 [Entophlyctis helioformis]|nr:hypothetical protein BC831DRAFT_443509 [Entophlyctis helioformis]
MSSAAELSAKSKQACDSCRRRKIRCSGGNPCVECVARSQQQSGHAHKSQASVHFSQATAQTAAAAFMALMSGVGTSSIPAASAAAAVADSGGVGSASAGADQSELIKQMSQRIAELEQQLKAAAISSSNTSNSNIPQTHIHRPPIPLPGPTLTSLSSPSPPMHMSASPGSDISSHSSTLATQYEPSPPTSFSKMSAADAQTLEIVVQNVCTAFPFIDPNNMLIEFSDAHIQVMRAVAARYRTPPRRGMNLQRYGEAEFRLALPLIGRFLFEGPSYGNIVALLLIGLWSVGAGIGDKALMSLSMAITMARLMGLHDETKYPVKVSWAEQQLRRRLWWGVFEVDRHACLAHHLPFMIEDADPARVPFPEAYTSTLFLTSSTQDSFSSQTTAMHDQLWCPPNEYTTCNTKSGNIKGSSSSNDMDLSQPDLDSIQSDGFAAASDTSSISSSALNPTAFQMQILLIISRIHKFLVREAAVLASGSFMGPTLGNLSIERMQLDMELKQWASQVEPRILTVHNVYVPRATRAKELTWRDALILAEFHAYRIELHLPNIARLVDLGLYSMLMSDASFSMAVESACTIHHLILVYLVHNPFFQHTPPFLHNCIIPAAKIIWMVGVIGYTGFTRGTPSGINATEADTMLDAFISAIEGYCMRRSKTPIAASPAAFTATPSIKTTAAMALPGSAPTIAILQHPGMPAAAPASVLDTGVTMMVADMPGLHTADLAAQFSVSSVQPMSAVSIAARVACYSHQYKPINSAGFADGSPLGGGSSSSPSNSHSSHSGDLVVAGLATTYTADYAFSGIFPDNQ